MLASLALLDGLPLSRSLGAQGPRTSFGLHLGLAVFGLMLVEQLFRRAHPQARWAIKPLCIALAGMFGFELFLYADAMLFTALDLDIWAARGVINALVVPLIAIAMARNPRWAVEMHVSRDVVLRVDGVARFGGVPARGRRSRIRRPLSRRRVGPDAANRIAVRRAGRRRAGRVFRALSFAAEGLRQQAFLFVSLRLPPGMAALHQHAFDRQRRSGIAGARHDGAGRPGREPGRDALAG